MGPCFGRAAVHESAAPRIRWKGTAVPCPYTCFVYAKVEEMDEYKGKSLSWSAANGVIELALDRAPANEIGVAMLDDLERFIAALPALESKASALIIYSKQKAGFSAGADLRELYTQARKMETASAVKSRTATGAGLFLSTGLKFGNDHDKFGRRALNAWRFRLGRADYALAVSRSIGSNPASSPTF